MLLEYGANADIESKAGFTPLHLAAQGGHADMTNLLLEHKADVNHSSKVIFCVNCINVMKSKAFKA